MNSSVYEQRLQGLDTLRALAIVMVLLYHYPVVVPGAPSIGVFSQIGWAGVDLFFVLSGYLIGNQVFAPLAQGRMFSWKVFVARRLLRTLPNYYAILAFYFVLSSELGGSGTAPLWQFLTFTQNFDLRYGQTFTHSWSLCIEEQFYLLLPLAVMVLLRTGSALKWGWCAVGLLMVSAMVVRGWMWANHGHSTFDQEIYYSSFTRADELLPGIALAMVKNFHPALYARVLGLGNYLLAAACLALAVVLSSLGSDALAGSAFMTVAGFSLLSASFAVLVLAALSPQCLLGKCRVPGAAQVALWSYAIYLAHKPIYKLMLVPLTNLHMDPQGVMSIAMVVTAGVAGGWLLFTGVETPFMQLRQRLFAV